MIADNSPENSALVIHMYDGLLQVGVRLCPTVQLEDICNHEGLTPLKLAAKEGKIEVSTAPPSPASLSCSRTRADNSYKYITHSGFSRPGPFIISPPFLSSPYIPFSHSVLFVLFCSTEFKPGHLCDCRFQTIHQYPKGSQGANDYLFPRNNVLKKIIFILCAQVFCLYVCTSVHWENVWCLWRPKEGAITDDYKL